MARQVKTRRSSFRFSSPPKFAAHDRMRRAANSLSRLVGATGGRLCQRPFVEHDDACRNTRDGDGQTQRRFPADPHRRATGGSGTCLHLHAVHQPPMVIARTSTEKAKPEANHSTFDSVALRSPIIRARLNAAPESIDRSTATGRSARTQASTGSPRHPRAWRVRFHQCIPTNQTNPMMNGHHAEAAIAPSEASPPQHGPRTPQGTHPAIREAQRGRPE